MLCIKELFYVLFNFKKKKMVFSTYIRLNHDIIAFIA